MEPAALGTAAIVRQCAPLRGGRPGHDAELDHLGRCQVVDPVRRRRLDERRIVEQRERRERCVRDDALRRALAPVQADLVVVLSREPSTLGAMAALGPSVTLECGKVGQEHGVDHAIDYLDACLHLSEIPAHAVASHDIDLYHTVAVVRVPPTVDFSFDGPAMIQFSRNLDSLNAVFPVR